MFQKQKHSSNLTFLISSSTPRFAQNVKHSSNVGLWEGKTAFDGGMDAALRLFTDYDRRPYLVESVEIMGQSVDAPPGTILQIEEDGALHCATRDGGTVRLRGAFRPIRSLADPELTVGTRFESTSPIALMTGYALTGLERVVFDT